MAARQELKHLAQLRLREAEAVFSAGLYDGSVYMCGYVVEWALKACIGATLRIAEYPDRRAHVRTHDFDELRLLAGLEQQIAAANPTLLRNWPVATNGSPEWRYQPVGTQPRSKAEAVLEAIRVNPDGVLAHISRRW
jgi:HEPN domain-containing protein